MYINIKESNQKECLGYTLVLNTRLQLLTSSANEYALFGFKLLRDNSSVRLYGETEEERDLWIKALHSTYILSTFS